jgi:hypothetical protein
MGLALRNGMLVAAAVAGAMIDAHPVGAVDPLNPNAPCSVFDQAPCNPSFCGVFGPWPCVPVLPPVGQSLRLTINSRGGESGRAPEGPINSLRELYAALRACWEPPPLNEAFRGMQMSVRFSFNRTGETVAAPRVTYASGEAGAETRRIYGRAIDAAIGRCTPMPFSKEMGAAVAGRPIAIRFVDDRPDAGG